MIEPQTMYRLENGITVALTLDDIANIAQMQEESELLVDAEKALLDWLNISLCDNQTAAKPAAIHGRQISEVLDDEDFMLKLVTEFRSFRKAEVPDSATWEQIIKKYCA